MNIDELIEKNELFSHIKKLEEFLITHLNNKSLEQKKVFEGIYENKNGLNIRLSYGYDSLSVYYTTSYNLNSKTCTILGFYYDNKKSDISSVITSVRMNDDYKKVNLKSSKYIQDLMELVKKLGEASIPLMIEAKKEHEETEKRIEEADPIKILRSSNISQLVETKKDA